MTEYNELKNNLIENVLDYLLDPFVAGAFAGRRFIYAGSQDFAWIMIGDLMPRL